jgi:signal transduction histidine kinase
VSEEEATYFWMESRSPDVISFMDAFGYGPWPDALFQEVAYPLREGRIYRSTASQRSGANAEHNDVLGSVSDVIVPIMVDGCYRACIGFDDHHLPREWTDAELAVLQTAANTIAAAIHQAQLQQTVLNERDKRIASERLRTEDALRMNRLLEGVVDASRALIESDDFDAAMQRCLNFLGSVIDADRVIYGEFDASLVDGTVTAASIEWLKPGVLSTVGMPIPATSDFNEWTEKLMRGELIWAHRDELREPASVAYWEATGCWTNLIVPIRLDGRMIGWLCFDFFNRREWEPAFGTVLKTAADGAAAAIKRRWAAEGMLEERDRRIAAEQLRADDAIQINRLLEGVVAASRALLEDDDFDGAMRRWLSFLGVAVNADRAIYGDFTRPPQSDSVTESSIEWIKSVETKSIGIPIPETSDFIDWAARLMRGERIWAHRNELSDPRSAEFWTATGCWTNLIVPVRVDHQTVGWLCFDFFSKREWHPALGSVLTTAADGAAAAIKRRLAIVGMLAERDKRIAIELTRAEEAERANAQLRRRDALLDAVARMSRELLHVSNWLDALPQSFERLGHAAGVQRIVLLQERANQTTTLNRELSHHVIFEWCAAGAIDHASLGLTTLRNSAAPYFVASLREGIPIWSHIDQLIDPIRQAFSSLSIVSTGCIPLMVDGRYWGALKFDDCLAERDWDSAEIDSLIAAANAVATAIGRHQAELSYRASERAWAEEQARQAQLLRHVVKSSRALIDVAIDDFEPALRVWLGNISYATKAIRATVYDIVLHHEAGIPTPRMLCEWSSPEIEGSIPVSFMQPYVIDPRGAEPLIEALLSGQAAVFQTENTSGRMHAFLEAQGNATVIAVPIFKNGQQWGCLSFDHAERRDEIERDIAVLETAADTLVAILNRNEAINIMLSERDRRIEVELARSNEALRHAHRMERHSTLLAAVANAAEELLAARDPDEQFDTVLRCIGEVTQAERACIARLDWTPDDPDLHGWQEITHEWTSSGTGRQSESHLQRFAMHRSDRTWQQVIEQFIHERRILARMDELDEPFRSEQLSLGVVWNLCYPIVIEEQIWGLLGFDYATSFDEYDEADLAALKTVASTIADALLRQRLEQRSLHGERMRADALRKANDELIASTSRLAALKDIPAFLDQVLLSMTRACDARTGSLILLEPEDKALHLRHCVIDDEIVPVTAMSSTDHWQPVPDHVHQQWQDQWKDESMVWHSAATEDHSTQDEHWSMRLQRAHHDSSHEHVSFPLNIGGEFLGIVELAIEMGSKPDEFSLQQAVVLAQQAAIALQMQRLAQVIERSAIRTERDRMAAEIHDSLAQSFTSIAMQSESLAGRMGKDVDYARVLKLIERTAREGLAEARSSVLALRPTDNDPEALIRALTQLADRCSVHGTVICRFATRGTPHSLRGNVCEALLRIAQEAASNAMRHSGGSQIQISLDYGVSRLQLRVEDDGIGYRPPTHSSKNAGFGVGGMQQRAHDIGAQFDLKTSSLGGTSIRVTLPYLELGSSN